MKSELNKDVVAGFGVFLLALPLCLAISVASGAPPMAGIISGIVGGIVGYFAGGQGLTIKGPAAGMIVIVLGAIQELGEGDLFVGYKLALAVAVVAGLVQLLIAFFKKAVFAEIMPHSVIHGLLAAIGVIIIAKQIYVLAGITPQATKPLTLLYQFPKKFYEFNPIALGIGILSFLIASFWPRIKKFSFIPSSLVILVLVVPLTLFFGLNVSSPKLLIHLPEHFFEGLVTPDFSKILTWISFKHILLFSLVGSVESLLTVCAMDALQKRGHASDLNKDLRAIGAVNLVGSFLGGLPVISEIVRSKANTDLGATSGRGNLFHGLFILLAAVCCPQLINLTPLSALAALLIFVGLRLASFNQFQLAYKEGWDQFLVFMTTFIVTLEVDLLVGVATGFCLELLLLCFRGHSLKDLFLPVFTLERGEDKIKLVIDGPLTFLSYLKFKNMLEEIAQEGKKIEISLSAVTYIDQTVMKKMGALTSHFKDVELTIDDNQQLVKFS